MGCGVGDSRAANLFIPPPFDGPSELLTFDTPRDCASSSSISGTVDKYWSDLPILPGFGLYLDS